MGASRGGRLPLPPVPGPVAAPMPAACPPPGRHQDDRCRRLRQWAAAVSSPLSCRREDEESHPSADQLPRLAAQPDKEPESSPCLSPRVPAVDPVSRMLGSPTREKRGKQTSRGAQRRHGAAAARIFHSVDTLVGTRHNGCKMTTFTRVTQGVQDMMLKRFGERNVANSEPWRFPPGSRDPTFKDCVSGSGSQVPSTPSSPGAEPVAQRSSLQLRPPAFCLQPGDGGVSQGAPRGLPGLTEPSRVVPMNSLSLWQLRFHVDEVLDIEPAVPFQLPTSGQLTT
ncbi:hypothetical protein P7K49_031953 [Saguinus oedipus]|uniref:CDT1 Geminin-binding domain-containing protein n=1 Tax=Saguinus oedipus TaxID=9490 RepID=A0ABQ9U1J0_SAGOE|nr:hypothetical protein P7K49_031953 [Saguinus oedipus]